MRNLTRLGKYLFILSACTAGLAFFNLQRENYWVAAWDTLVALIELRLAFKCRKPDPEPGVQDEA